MMLSSVFVCSSSLYYVKFIFRRVWLRLQRITCVMPLMQWCKGKPVRRSWFLRQSKWPALLHSYWWHVKWKPILIRLPCVDYRYVWSLSVFCYVITIHAGQLVFPPSGWIVCTLSPRQSSAYRASCTASPRCCRLCSQTCRRTFILLRTMSSLLSNMLVQVSVWDLNNFTASKFFIG
jgi:hypothetical protein